MKQSDRELSIMIHLVGKYAINDLVRIEGIGPGIKKALEEINITTYQQLAEVDIDVLKGIKPRPFKGYKHEDLKQQAEFIVEGKWMRLAKLQDELRPGK